MNPRVKALCPQEQPEGNIRGYCSSHDVKVSVGERSRSSSMGSSYLTVEGSSAGKSSYLPQLPQVLSAGCLQASELIILPLS